MGAVAWWITILGTFATYTAYFMPEAILNFFMVLFILGLVRFGDSNRFLVWLGLGFVLGIASLAKPHALFVVPALLIYIFLSVWSTKQSSLKSSAFRIGTFLCSLVLTKLGFGYLIAGQNGLSLFGSYGSAVSSGEAVSQTLGANTWQNVPETILGQTLMIVMIIGVALPVSLVGLIQSLKKDKELFVANRFRALFSIALLNMMAVSALFEAWQNLNIWMHTRYYSYLIPLVILVLYEAYSQRELERSNISKRIIVGIFVVVSVYALFTQGKPFGANWIDAPDFLAHIRNVEISSILIVSTIAISIFWIWNSKTSMALAIAVSVLASGFAGWHTTIFLNEAFGKADSFQQVGRLLSNYLPQEELDKTVIFGTDAVAMQRTLFYSLSGGATAIGGTQAEYDKTEIDPATRWILVYGEPMPQLGQPHLTGIGYQLYSLTGDPSSPPRTSELKGFSNPCTDSANSGWVCGAETALSLNEPFPANAKVDLVFDVGDGLVGKEIEFSLGDSKGVVTVPDGRYALSVSFQNAGEVSELFLTAKSQNLGESGVEQKTIRLVSINVD
jgi:phosphoglycerol transferase